MSAADAAWLHMDRPTNLMVITSALWFDEPLYVEELKLVTLERVVERYPRFRQRIVDGARGPHWEDVEDFDIDLHVHHLALPEPGDRATLEATVADIMSHPLDPALPLWSLHLLDGYGDGCAVVCRMHHAIADGIALARVMLGMTDSQPTAAQAKFGDGPRRAPRRLPFEGAVRAVGGIAGAMVHEATETLLHPEHVTDLARAGAADAAALARILTLPNERRHPLHDRLGIGQRVAWSEPLDLDAVKATAHVTGTTVNDVLVACVTGALRAHLERSGEPVDDLRAMVPFNLRPLDEPLPRELGNRFGLVTLSLPVHVADPLERLLEVSRRMTAIKQSRQGPVAYGILGLIGHAPLGVEARVVDLFAGKATMVLTNVPGPHERVYLAGVPVAGVLAWAPCSGEMGMSASIFSYDGTVTVGFMVNGRLLDDVSGLVATFEAAAGELQAAVAPV